MGGSDERVGGVEDLLRYCCSSIFGVERDIVLQVTTEFAFTKLRYSYLT